MTWDKITEKMEIVGKMSMGTGNYRQSQTRHAMTTHWSPVQTLFPSTARPLAASIQAVLGQLCYCMYVVNLLDACIWVRLPIHQKPIKPIISSP